MHGRLAAGPSWIAQTSSPQKRGHGTEGQALSFEYKGWKFSEFRSGRGAAQHPQACTAYTSVHSRLRAALRAQPTELEIKPKRASHSARGHGYTAVPEPQT